MKLPEQTRPGQPIPLNIRDKEHTNLVDWCMERAEHSFHIKREVEKEGLRAFRHLTSTIDLEKHRWPYVTYDPSYYASTITREASYARAFFGNPPLMSTLPGDNTRWEESEAVNASLRWHLDRIGIRGTFNEITQSLETVGSCLIHGFWDFEEQDVWYWKRQPREVPLPIDPTTGQAGTMWVDQGNERLVREKIITRDHPNFKAIHITAALLDDSETDIQKGEWVGMVFELSGREARSRCKTGPKWSRWNSQAVEKALNGEVSPTWKWGTVMSNQREWTQEIGLGGSGSKTNLAPGLSRQAETDLRGIVAIELWRKHKGGIQRIVLLGGAFIAWYGWSPYGHGKYPFVFARNYRLAGQFFGLSSYRVVKWLIRGLQTHRCAAGTEASLAAMPPMTYPDQMTIIGKQWAPGAEWRLQGGTFGEINFLNRSDAGRSIANSEAASLQQQMDVAYALSDVGRGSAGGNRGSATGQSIAAERMNVREDYLMQNFGYDTLVPMTDQAVGMMCQLQDYGVQVHATGNPKGEPITVYPEQFRGGNYIATASPTVPALQEQHKRKFLELYELAAKYQEPNANRRSLFEEVVNTVAPGERDQIMKSLEEVNGEMGQQGGPPIQGQPGQGSVMQGAGDSVAQAAAELREAYAG